MAISRTQSANSYPAGTLSLTVTAGSLMWAWLQCNASADTMVASGGGTWVHGTKVASVGGTSAATCRMGYVISATGGATSISTSGSTNDPGYAVHVYSWGGPTGTFGVESMRDQTNVANPSAAAVTPAADGALCVGGLGDEAVSTTPTWGSGFGAVITDVQHFHFTADLIQTTAASIALTTTRASSAGGVVVGFMTFLPGVIHHKQSAQTQVTTAGSTQASVTITANAINNVIMVGGGSLATSGTLAVADTQGNVWTTSNPLKVNPSDSSRMQGWYALAKNTLATTITVTASVGSAFVGIYVDEFDNDDTTTPIGAHDEAGAGSGAVVSGALVLTADNSAVWSCLNDSATAVGNIDGAAATKGCDDGGGDWTEYRVLSGRKGASVTAAFTGSGIWNLITAEIRPSGATAPPLPAGIKRFDSMRFPKVPLGGDLRGVRIKP